MCSLVFFHPIIHQVISNRSSPPARRAPGAFLLSNKCSVQSSVHPPPQRADSGHQLFPSHHFPRSSETFNGHSRVIGWVNLWPPVLTWTKHTRPSCPENTSSTRPRGHCPRGAFWSTTSTTPPTFRLSFFSLHFFRVFSVARNSSLHRFQNIFTRFWINLHWFLGLNASSSVHLRC